MKIGILTQPLHNNYGGLLQAYALKEILHYLGHETVIINRRFKRTSYLHKQASILKNRLLKRNIPPSLFINNCQSRIIGQENLSFQKKYIPELSELIDNNKGMADLNNMGFDAYVVGSDQCWRPVYSPDIRNYFLDFVKDETKVKRISYAASFGVSNWEFNEEDTIKCRALLQKFDAVSVRENTGINLVKVHLNRNDAVNLLDPTMLLPLDRYEEIISNEKVGISTGELKVYILDKSADNNDVVKFVENKLNYKPFEVLPEKSIDTQRVTKDNISSFIYPNPAKWLRGFKDAKFVVTDSFHGTVFSILYNVPFITIGNESRGNTRVESLLNMFDLSDRFISKFSRVNIETIISKRINWENVNTIINNEQVKAINFLTTHLN